MTEPNKENNAETALPPEGEAQGRRRYRRRMGDAGGAGEESAPIWVLTFTDVMGLMLTFFVMLFAMSEPEQQQWADVSAALNNEFNKFYGKIMERGPTDSINLSRIDYDQALDIKYLEALLESTMANNEQLGGVKLIPQAGQLVLSLPQDLLFESGQADIKSDGARAIYALGGMLSRIKNKIEVTGHADPRPVSRAQDMGKYSSNWELSLARAANVAGLLNSVGYERAIDIRGLSSGRYDDMAAVIADEAQRIELSRRVDIVIMNHDGRRKEQLFEIGLP